MVQAKSKKAVGLGNALMNDRFGRGSGADRKKSSTAAAAAAGGGVTRINHSTGESYITNARPEASWVKLRSVTQQSAMDEFLSTAQLADTDFTAEKANNVKIIRTDGVQNPFMLSGAEERSLKGKYSAHRGKLTVPRRPSWDETTTPEELDRDEREAFLSWRRGLAQLQESDADLLMTPFERNLEVWRQLWRVIERSDVVVQIVDGRDPLMFRSEDLEACVKEAGEGKRNLLLVNKADMLTLGQRREWARYFKEQGIAFRFFSARLAKEENEGRVWDNDDDDDEEAEDEDEDEDEDEGAELELEPELEPREPIIDQAIDDTRILGVQELEDLFLQHAPPSISTSSTSSQKLQIGLVGYPNVGKSSTINALLGAKKVSVSSTPGKTKHFQTIHLSPRVLLCDCPGLVFPNFATTKAHLVAAGVLPIDQLRDYSGPATLVAQRIPRLFLEAIYGIDIPVKPREEGGDGTPVAADVLEAYANARGFHTQGLGMPDQARAARHVLKDYVNGKLPYVEPPPAYVAGAAVFNADLYGPSQLVGKKQREALTSAMEALETADENGEVPVGGKAKKLDSAFFGDGPGNAGHKRMPFNHRYSERGQEELAGGVGGKKHFKGGAKGKGKGKKRRAGLDD